MTGAQLAVIDVDDRTGPSSHAVAAVEGWAQTLASPSTRRSYRAAVRSVLDSEGAITPAAVAAWRDAMAASGLGRATIRQRLAAVRAFATWAARTGALPAELVVALSAVQAPRLTGQHAPRALDERQLRLMDRAAGAAWPDDPLRMAQARIVLRLLAGCGLRVSELVHAQRADLVAARPSVADRAELAGRDVDGWSMHVRGKGGRRRTVPVPASARKAVLTLHRIAGVPSLDPAVKRLAVPVPDHSLESAGFEGVYAGAERGSGAVIVWDEGAFELVRDEPGHLVVELRGEKLRGGFALTRTSERQWLLVKLVDEEARRDSDVVAEQPRSVRSGRTWQELAAG